MPSGEREFYNKVGKWFPAYSIISSWVRRGKGEHEEASRRMRNMNVRNVVSEGIEEKKTEVMSSVENAINDHKANINKAFQEWKSGKEQDLNDWVAARRRNLRTALPWIMSGTVLIVAAGVGIQSWRRKAARKVKVWPDRGLKNDKQLTTSVPSRSSTRIGFSIKPLGVCKIFASAMVAKD